MTQAHRPRKRFGQNFLRDAAVIEQIAAAVIASPGQTVVEIGPGRAALTRALLQRLPESAKLSAIELDRDLLPALNAIAAKDPRFSVQSGDVLDADFAALRKQSDQPLLVCGNLPYNISTPLLLKLLDAQLAWPTGSAGSVAADAEPLPLMSGMLFMMQREVVERICASAGSKAYGRLSIVLQAAFEAELLFDVGPEAFDPPPKVTSSIVRLVPRQHLAMAAERFPDFQRLVATAFAQRRKTLRKNLAALLDASELEDLGIDPMRRPETLSIEEFVAISDLLDNKH